MGWKPEVNGLNSLGSSLLPAVWKQALPELNASRVLGQFGMGTIKKVAWSILVIQSREYFENFPPQI